MFRLIKLAAYAILGYALYEFFRGLTADTPSANTVGSRGGSQGQSRPAGLTGGGAGKTLSTAEADGGTATRTVGRGVVTR